MNKKDKLSVSIVHFPELRLEVKDRHNRVIMTATGETALDCIERMLRWVDGVIADRGLKP